MVLELRQHLQQEDDGSVHMRGEASRSVNLIHRNSPDALRSGEEEEKRRVTLIVTLKLHKTHVGSHSVNRKSSRCGREVREVPDQVSPDQRKGLQRARRLASE